MADNIRMIVGLGNPGAEYQATRHNAGFWFVDELAHRCSSSFRAEGRFFGEVCRIQVGASDCWLLKPMTFMNRSGQAVSALANYYKIEPEEILVAHDELDLPAGAAKLKQGGGHAGHNGLRDIIKALGSREFWRLRIGIDHPGSAKQVVDYVLGRASKEEFERIEDVIRDASALLPELLRGESQLVMNRLHGER